MNMTYERLMRHLDDREVHYPPTAKIDRSRPISAAKSAPTDHRRRRCRCGTVRSSAARRCDSPKRSAVGGETIIRANYRLNIGKFEMDFDEGELHFHASQILTTTA